MTDNQLFTLVRGVLLAGLTRHGLTGWEVARAFQPKQQGANSAPTVYLFKVGPDRRHGWPQAKYAWDNAGLKMDATHSQQYESTFQASVLMDESTDPDALTQSDAANVATAIMQSDEALTALRAAGVGVLRVGEVRNPYDVNDRGQFDADASFDFVLTYRRSHQSIAPHAAAEASIHRV